MTEVNRKQGTRPLVTAGRKNCGVSSFISNENQKIFSKTSLTIDMFANTFFRDYQFSADDNILVLNNKTLSKETLLFISAVLDSINYYTYGKQYRLQNFYRQLISLPVTSIKKPNWDYMEQYIANLIDGIEVPKLEISTPSPLSLNSVKWSLLPTQEIFKTVKRGTRLTKSDQSEGNIAYISSTGLNNGIDRYISIPKKRHRIYSNFIGVNNSGSIGKAFYHAYEAIVSDHVTALVHEKLNEYNSKFLISCIEQSLDGNFSFNREISDGRLKRQMVKIPVTPDNQPNWQFMEDYIKSLSNSNLI